MVWKMLVIVFDPSSLYIQPVSMSSVMASDASKVDDLMSGLYL